MGRLPVRAMGTERDVGAPLEGEASFATEEALRTFGEALGRVLEGGEVFALVGALGAGKTAFTQSLARGLGVSAATPVVSPTFVLHRRYAGRVVLEHLDAYRLASAQDLEALGIEELLEGGGVVVVEWADKVAAVFPEHTVWLMFDVTGPTSRRVALRVPPQARFGSGLRDVLRAAGCALRA